jgi:hypothetical protein
VLGTGIHWIREESYAQLIGQLFGQKMRMELVNLEVIDGVKGEGMDTASC